MRIEAVALAGDDQRVDDRSSVAGIGLELRLPI
jgi:hypothetical protein